MSQKLFTEFTPFGFRHIIHIVQVDQDISVKCIFIYTHRHSYGPLILVISNSDYKDTFSLCVLPSFLEINFIKTVTHSPFSTVIVKHLNC